MAVTPADVRVVYPGTAASDPTIQVHIDTAALIIADELADSGLSQTRLDKIQTYLAAHFLYVSETGGGAGGGLKSEKMGEAEDTYFSPEETGGFGLASTSFGQQAMVLDTTGTLAGKASSNLAPAQFRVV
jgi:hypothetical protein